ncbi:MAG: hypothetical protein F6K25_12075 [Okeania sp. SIO2G4]|uniref:hypothetical protein n=1 Tax=Okeania sp. SIO2G4 TaxID=2607793 RepID=UPI0013C96D9B|nr:hypothetical protein [Okeania sp. SIO2G4]NEQ91404.1 hypothetical protein [Okeania sp. SIO2G4]
MLWWSAIISDGSELSPTLDSDSFFNLLPQILYHKFNQNNNLYHVWLNTYK